MAGRSAKMERRWLVGPGEGHDFGALGQWLRFISYGANEKEKDK